MIQISSQFSATCHAVRLSRTTAQLIGSAIDAFGGIGFEAASTRTLATAGKVNLSVVPIITTATGFLLPPGIFLRGMDWKRTQLVNIRQVPAMIRDLTRGNFPIGVKYAPSPKTGGADPLNGNTFLCLWKRSMS